MITDNFLLSLILWLEIGSWNGSMPERSRKQKLVVKFWYVQWTHPARQYITCCGSRMLTGSLGQQQQQQHPFSFTQHKHHFFWGSVTQAQLVSFSTSTLPDFCFPLEALGGSKNESLIWTSLLPFPILTLWCCPMFPQQPCLCQPHRLSTPENILVPITLQMSRSIENYSFLSTRRVSFQFIKIFGCYCPLILSLMITCC